MDAAQGHTALVEEDARLDMSFDAAHAPFVAIWVNRKGWSSHPKRRPQVNLSIGPSSGAPDSLTEALGPWKSASWLEPGETKEWTRDLELARAL